MLWPLLQGKWYISYIFIAPVWSFYHSKGFYNKSLHSPIHNYRNHASLLIRNSYTHQENSHLEQFGVQHLLHVHFDMRTRWVREWTTNPLVSNFCIYLLSHSCTRLPVNFRVHLNILPMTWLTVVLLHTNHECSLRSSDRALFIVKSPFFNLRLQDCMATYCCPHSREPAHQNQDFFPQQLFIRCLCELLVMHRYCTKQVL